MSSFVSLADESDEKGEACGVVAENSEWEVVYLWLEVGGFLAMDERRYKGFCVRYLSLSNNLQLSNYAIAVL